MRRRALAVGLVIAGGIVAVLGVAMLSIPLAIILSGVGIAALGLTAVEVSP